MLSWGLGCVALGCGDDECKDCAPPPTSQSQDDPTSSSVDAATSGASPSESRDSVTGDFVPECQVDEDCPAGKQICSPAQQCVTCDSHDDCSAERPYCKVANDERANRCVACQKGTDCGPEGEWLCLSEQCFAACDPESKQPCDEGLVCVAGSEQTLTYCAECGPGIACANADLLCVENACWACNPATHDGCSGTTPYCSVSALVPLGTDGGGSSGASEEPHCAECRTGGEFDDCGSGTCVDGSCQVCSPGDNAGCGGSTPICSSVVAEDGGLEGAECVQCVDHDDCTDHAAGAYCVNNACAACDDQTNEGCEGTRGACVNVAPISATPLFECRECSDACEGGAICLEFTCVECVTSADCLSPGAAECSPEHTCVPCTGDAACETQTDAPFCHKPSGTCITCRSDEDCSEVEGKPGCDPSRHVCVECTNDSHCPEAALGCLIIPSVGQYTCSSSMIPGELGPCVRCSGGDCADGLECAEIGEDNRCLPPDDGSGACAGQELYSEDQLGYASFCVPEACAP